MDGTQDDSRWLGLYEVKRNGNATISKTRRVKHAPKPVEVYFAGSVAPELVIE
ncbi:hypothetical protein BDR04DRAFT_1091208 [Suillus decipiens]|nr:hypothetical protein BDR04DRAFT_1091208 [Suillus decipiens]